MRALRLELVRRRPAWPGWMVLIIGFGLAADAGLKHQRLHEQIDETQRPRNASRQSHRAGGDAVSPETQRELDAARRLLGELALPWQTLFRSIEASVDKDTALLAIEPEPDKRAVRIIGEARNYRAVLDFVVRLEQGPVFSRIHLLNHQIREDVAERPFVFTLTASWGDTL